MWGADPRGARCDKRRCARHFRHAVAILHSPDVGAAEQAIHARGASVGQRTIPRLTTQVPKVSGRCSISLNPAAVIAVRSFSALRKVSTERGR